MKKTIGIVRNKTHGFSELRRQRKLSKTIGVYSSGNRFSKQRLGGAQEIELSESPETLKRPFIDDLSTVNSIDEPKPQWMSYYQECLSLLRGVQDLRKDMLINQNKRLTCIKVAEEKSYELRIYDCAKQRIKKCEKLIDAIKVQAKKELPAHERVCMTVCFRLASDIQESTKQLRAQQKSFVEQRKQFQVTEKASFLQLAADHMLNMGNGMQQLVQDEAMRDLQQRNEQIRHIVQSIYELSDIYKELSEMVLLQGSLLDRIDANIEASRDAVEKGVAHLVSAETRQKKTGRCVCGIILVLLVLNGILLIVLCVKWFK